MALSLSQLKKNTKKNLDTLIKEADKVTKGSSQADERFWKPTLDKAGNGFALIRFLPAPRVDGADGLAWVRYWDHAFKGPTGRWYIEKSLTTLGQPDPVSEYNSTLWNSGDEEDKKLASKQKRNLRYVSNILVINDPANPENNGKVFLFRYGKKIFDKIKAVLSPEEGLGEEPNDPFNFWTGQNFKLKVKNVGGFVNYDDSSFAAPSAVSENDDEIEALWNAEHSLKEFVDPSTFKSYDELKRQFELVVGADTDVARTAEALAMDVEETYENHSKEDDDASLDSILEDLKKI